MNLWTRLGIHTARLSLSDIHHRVSISYRDYKIAHHETNRGGECWRDLVQARFHGKEQGYLMLKDLQPDCHTKDRDWIAKFRTQKNVNLSEHMWYTHFVRRVLDRTKSLSERMETEINWYQDVPSLLMLKFEVNTEKELLDLTVRTDTNKLNDRLALVPRAANNGPLP